MKRCGLEMLRSLLNRYDINISVDYTVLIEMKMSMNCGVNIWL